MEKMARLLDFISFFPIDFASYYYKKMLRVLKRFPFVMVLAISMRCFAKLQSPC